MRDYDVLTVRYSKNALIAIFFRIVLLDDKSHHAEVLIIIFCNICGPDFGILAKLIELGPLLIVETYNTF